VCLHVHGSGLRPGRGSVRSCGAAEVPGAPLSYRAACAPQRAHAAPLPQGTPVSALTICRPVIDMRRRHPPARHALLCAFGTECAQQRTSRPLAGHYRPLAGH